MSVQYSFSCDGCGKTLSNDELSLSQRVAQSYAEKLIRESPTSDLSLISEHFCSICQASAEEYWAAKPELVRTLAEECKRRIEKHRRGFFQERKAKARSHNLKVVQNG